MKTAEALKIKGIVDCVETEESSSNSRRPSTSSSNSSQAAPLTPPIADSLSAEQIPPPPPNCVSDAVTSAAVPLADATPLQHPAGDLSLLATAAASALAAAAAAAAASTPPLPTSAAAAAGAAVMDYAPSAGGALPPNPKRRKTAPRKLGSFLSSSPSHEPFRSVTNVKYSILVIAFLLPRSCTGTGFSMNTTVTVPYRTPPAAYCSVFIIHFGYWLAVCWWIFCNTFFSLDCALFYFDSWHTVLLSSLLFARKEPNCSAENR